MGIRPCGHPLPDPLEGAELACTRYRCRRRVIACVVFIGEALDRLGWRIEPTCRRHLRLHEGTARRARDRDHPGVYRHHPDLERILDWIHADGRCGLDHVALRASDGYRASGSSSNTTRDISGSQT